MLTGLFSCKGRRRRGGLQNKTTKMNQTPLPAPVYALNKQTNKRLPQTSIPIAITDPKTTSFGQSPLWAISSAATGPSTYQPAAAAALFGLLQTAWHRPGSQKEQQRGYLRCCCYSPGLSFHFKVSSMQTWGRGCREDRISDPEEQAA